MQKLAVAKVSFKGAKQLRQLDPWCFRTDVTEAPDAQGGQVVEVQDLQGNFIGQAFWAEKSPLALRLLTRKKPEEEPVNEAFFRQRLETAIGRRASLASRDAYRLCHGESDGIPGLLVDRYGKGLTLQTLSQGADARKEMFAKMLVELCGATQVVCRDDASGRDFEGLPREARVLVGAGEARVTFHEGQNAFTVDLLKDMKTGAFLDQVDNHLRAGELGEGDALDCFSYHGGFALALARRCKTVLAVEEDAKAAERAQANAKANGYSNVEVQCANAFDLLHAFDKDGRKFDTVVVDPPAFGKRKEGVTTALSAYRELNLRAMRILRPNGLLVTCSCSGKVSREDFEAMLLECAQDARRQIQVLERRGAGMDHPPLLGLSRTEYLKAFFLRVL